MILMLIAWKYCRLTMRMIIERVRLAVNHQRQSEHAAILLVERPPGTIADDDQPIALREIIAGRKRPSKLRVRAEIREEHRRNSGSVQFRRAAMLSSFHRPIRGASDSN
jgi:hypothetical protein